MAQLPLESPSRTRVAALQVLQASAVAAMVLAGNMAHPLVVRAQTPTQQFVYVSVPVTGASPQVSSQVWGFVKNTTQPGILVPLSNPWVPDAQEGGLAAVDGQSKYLFLLNGPTSNEISMFQIGGAGNLTEVTGTPFASTDASSPISLATERSGQYLYVGYQNGSSPGQSAITLFQIISGRLNPLTPSLTFTGTPVAMLTDPQGVHLYVALGGLNQSTGTPYSGVTPYNINAGGALTPAGAAFNGGENGRCLAIDPLGRFLFYGYGSLDGSVASIQLQADGSFGATTSIGLGQNVIPQIMLVDSTGEFLYVSDGNETMLYSIDPTTGALTQPQTLTDPVFEAGKAVADPSPPYVYSYSARDSQIHVYSIGSGGALSEISGSPITANVAGAKSLVISTIPTQNVSGPLVGFVPTSVDLGSELVGQTSSSQTVKIVNTGGETLIVNTISLAGANPADFTATPGCTLPVSLAPLGSSSPSSCTISVTFTPAAAGARAATLTATDNAPDSPQSMQLSGNGTAPQPAVALVPGSLTFPSTAQNTTSASQSVTVSNSGAAPLHVSSAVLSGANPGDFAVAGSTCTGSAVAVNASCSIGVTFTPLGAGARDASIVITDDAPNSPQSVALSGTGAAPAPGTPGATLSATTLNFAAITQGATSAAQTVTLTSSGSGTLHIASVVPGGANLSDYTITSTCAAAPYAVNATCTISVIFGPLSSGTRVATVAISDDAPNSPQTIAIGGSANPAFTVTAAAGGATSAIINAGQTATYNLQLTAGAGFAGNVSFSCSGAPANATCTVPGTLQVSGGNPVAFTVSVATLGSGALPRFFEPPRNGPIPALRILFAAWVVFLVLMYREKRSGAHAVGARLAIASVALMLVLVAGFGLSGCGGGSAAAPASQVQSTPHGSSTIVVTPTATTASGKQLGPLPPIQLSLTVN